MTTTINPRVFYHNTDYKAYRLIVTATENSGKVTKIVLSTK